MSANATNAAATPATPAPAAGVAAQAEDEIFSLSLQEFYALSRELETKHSIFYQLWELGRPVFTRDVETAAVGFDKAGACYLFMFNPDFWKACSPAKRL